MPNDARRNSNWCSDWWNRVGVVEAFRSPPSLDGSMCQVYVGISPSGNKKGESERPESKLLEGTNQVVKDRAIILNHKDRHCPEGKEYRSVSELVAEADGQTVTAWRDRLREPEHAVLILEDTSLDTCFALLLLGLSLASNNHSKDCKCDQKPKNKWAKWIEYVRAWESGRYLDGEDKKSSVAVLHAALSHSYKPNETNDPADADPVAAEARSAKFTEQFRACMDLLNSIFLDTEDPLSPRFPKARATYHRALSHYALEHQQYLLALNQAVTCQLQLPLRDSTERIIVDALILTETRPTGILKILARTDRENTWTRNGFALLAIYRPGLKGTGNDMTISVTPESGTTLEDLWRELEKLEDKRWASERPRDNPRKIRSYEKGGGPNQPWWDDQGNFTILGAPKALDGKNHELGAKTKWEDVLDLLWKLYAPIPNIDPTKPDWITKKIISGKRYCLVEWRYTEVPTYTATPTFNSWLAALSLTSAEPTIATLPAPDEFQVTRIPGGSLYAHRNGATLFNDWMPEEFPLSEMDDLFTRLASITDGYCQLVGEEAHKAIVKAQAAFLNCDGFSSEAKSEWESILFEKKKKRLTLETQLIARPIRDDLRDASRSMLQCWGTEEKRKASRDLIVDLDGDTQTILLHQKERSDRLFLAGAAGFASAISVNQVLQIAQQKFTRNNFEWQLEILRPALETPHIEILEAIADQALKWETIVFFGSILGMGVGVVVFFWPHLSAKLLGSRSTSR